LPIRRTPSIARPSSACSGGIERLQRVDARRERRLDRRAAQRSVQAASGDLDLGQLGHGVEGTLPAVAERLAIIGWRRGGMSAAAQALRRDPSLEVVAFERGPYTSYSACGIPYFIAQDFTDSERLIVRGRRSTASAASTCASATRSWRSTSTRAS
jgi:hypothetical protein